MFGIAGNRIVDKIIYSLEKQYSRMIVIRHQLGVLVDPANGLSSVDTQDFNVRAIVLPEENVRKHLYNAAYLSMSRNFTYGALFDLVMTPIIVKKSRVAHVKLTTDDYCLISQRDGWVEEDYETVPRMIQVRYDFKHIAETTDGRAYHILTRQSPAVQDFDNEAVTP